MSQHLARPLLAAALLAGLLGAGCGRQDAPVAPVAPALSSGDELLTTETVQTAPSLFECPAATADSATAVIGAEGGAVVAGRFRVDFPAGAVAVPQTFALTVVAGPYLEIEVHAEGYAHYEFAAPVTVTLDLTRCSGIPSGLQAWHIDSQTKALLEYMGGQLDLHGRTLRFRTTHFSGYSVAW